MKAKQPGIEEQIELVREQVDTYRRWWEEANAKLRDCERECEQLRADLEQARDVDDGR